MRSENEVRSVVSELLEVVINPSRNIDDWDYEQAHLRLSALLWVLGKFDRLPFWSVGDKNEGRR